MGPFPGYRGSSSRQAPARCRMRRCLLKGCEQPFQPGHPLQRYCSHACRQAARRWSRWRANQSYRASEHGRCCRREQSRRWRSRAAARRCPQPPAEPPCEGYHKPQPGEDSCCSRPGCYERFCPSSRSPLQTFCSCSCRRALRRVLQRELRWLRRRIALRGPGGKRSHWADP